MMIGQSATGQVELRPFINYLWCSLKFFPLFAIIKSLWRSCEVQWCDLLRLWSVQTFCQSLSTHNQGHEIYNLSEKELLYKQRISLELLEVKSILSVAFKFLALALGTTWYSISEVLSQIFLTSGGQQDLPWYLEAQRRDLIWASGRTFSTIVITINGMIMAMLLEMAE